jgi:hypothetical protein
VRDTRRAEVASDVFEQLSASTPGNDTRTRRLIAGRALRGAVGDIVWRIEEGRTARAQRRLTLGRPRGMRAVWATWTQTWFTPIAVCVGAYNVMLAVGVSVDASRTMPGRVIEAVLLLSAAAAMFTGLRLRCESSHDTRAVSPDSDVALLPDALMVFGVIPALLFFQMGVPPILAVAVIAGVITSRAHEQQAAAL